MVTKRDVSTALLTDVKNYLDITWSDNHTDAKITELIRGGMMYLDSKYGGEADYESDGFARTLLEEYVRYARDSALDVFENNYRALILAMQNQKAVSTDD